MRKRKPEEKEEEEPEEKEGEDGLERSPSCREADHKEGERSPSCQETEGKEQVDEKEHSLGRVSFLPRGSIVG